MIDRIKSNSGLLLLLIFPLIGLAAVGIALRGGSDSGPGGEGELDVGAIPSPPPLETTPIPTLRPTVTPRPILDSPAPVLPLTDPQTEETYTLLDIDSPITVVNFWATWCPPCVREMPTLEAFAESNADVTILAVTDPQDGQTPERIREFLKENEIDTLTVAYDESGQLRKSFYAFNLPMTFVLDSEGIVRFRQIGEVTRSDLIYYANQLRYEP